MSASEGRQIERGSNRFTITWAKIIVKFMVGSIEKIFQIRYALTFSLSVVGMSSCSSRQLLRLFSDLTSRIAQGLAVLDLKPSHLKCARLL